MHVTCSSSTFRFFAKWILCDFREVYFAAWVLEKSAFKVVRSSVCASARACVCVCYLAFLTFQLARSLWWTLDVGASAELSGWAHLLGV